MTAGYGVDGMISDERKATIWKLRIGRDEGNVSFLLSSTDAPYVRGVGKKDREILGRVC